MANSVFSMASDGNGTIVSVGGSGTIFVSTDSGVTWVQTTSGTVEHLYGVAHGATTFGLSWTVVGASGVVLTSTDALNWTVQTSFTSQTLNGIAYANGAFLAVGDVGTFAISNDAGVTWAALDSTTTEDLYSISISAAAYLIVGSNDTVITGDLTAVADQVFVVEQVNTSGPVNSTAISGLGATESISAFAANAWNINFGAGGSAYSGEVSNPIIVEGVNTATFGSEANGTMAEAVAQTVGLQEISVGFVRYYRVVSDIITGSSSSTWLRRVEAEVLEPLSAYGLLTVAEVTVVVEYLTSATQAQNIGVFGSAVAENIGVGAKYILASIALALESMSLTEASTHKFEIVQSLVERVVFSEGLSSGMLASEVLALTMAISASESSGKGGDATELITATETVIQNTYATYLALVNIAVTSAVQNSLVLTLPATEGISISGEATPNQILQQLLTEGVMFDLSFGFDGAVYSGWVMNTDTFAVSEYQNYPFNSFAKIGGDYYGANDNGIYKLDGADDAGTAIDATFTTGKMSFGGRLSRVANSYLAIRNDGTILLKTITDDNIEYWYELTSTSWTLHDKRVKLGRGLKSRYWQFTISNVSGADFELDELVIYPITMKRR